MIISDYWKRLWPSVPYCFSGCLQSSGEGAAGIQSRNVSFPPIPAISQLGQFPLCLSVRPKRAFRPSVRLAD
jgi:hypothetical protein